MKKHTAPARMVGRYLALTSLAFLVTILFVKFVPVNQTTVALTFLVLVLFTASKWRLAYSVYLSVLCTLLYNFFFLPPVGKLTIADPQNWVALGAFLSTSVLVSHISDREHRQAEASEARRREIQLLYSFSQQLLLQDELRGVARTTPSVLASVFGFRGVALYVRAHDAVFYSDPDNRLLSAIDLTSWAESEEPVSTVGEVKLIPLRLGVHHDLGVLALTDDEYDARMYEAIGSLVSVALERAAALESTNRLEAARESEKLRSALIDSVTHDLRTPLTAIRAAATTLVSEEHLPEGERLDLIAVVDEESARLDRLIGQAVEMAQLDAESLRVEINEQSVRELIDLTLERMAYRLANHPVNVRIPEDLPDVPMDRTLIQRVLQHLIENAAKFSPTGLPITIAAKAVDGRLLVTVEDPGPGIDPDDLPFIFEKYFRGKHQKVTSTGTGMGLAIARAILKAHHGEIAVRSKPGHGAQFTFWIPISSPESQETETGEAYMA
jgi:two-component system, OmpR family, sensor histidine kinase KdpD